MKGYVCCTPQYLEINKENKAMRIVLKYLVLASFMLALPVFAQAADKVGVVNTQDVFMNSDAGKRVTQDLESKFKAKQQEFNREGDSIKQAADDLNKKAGVMSAEAKQKEQAALQARYEKLMNDQNAASQTMMQEKNKLIEPLMKTLDQVVTDYAKKNGFTVIIDRGAALFVAPDADVTAAIAKAFDAASKGK